MHDLRAEVPPHTSIQELDLVSCAPAGYPAFEIRPSALGSKKALILPDIAVCEECLREMNDSNDRRYHYPFTNCTHCGPRFSIITGLPYDRTNTTMRGFTMCAECRAEYEDPANRRFHAQPIACPQCGPQLALIDGGGQCIAVRSNALDTGVDVLLSGQIVAVKGLGGFHLMVDAADDAAVMRLRQRKNREEKPFALMYPSLEAVRQHCDISDLAESLLLSHEAPIVITSRRFGVAGPAEPVAPKNPHLGVMLPYTPLHHLLMQRVGRPLVATSGNLAEEPICTDEIGVVDRLGGVADVFLVHDRPIARPVDDSVVRIVGGRPMLVRRARGYAPLPIFLDESSPPVLAVGAHLKNTVALVQDKRVFVSQHIGDLSTALACAAFQDAIQSLQSMYEVAPELITCDAHPDYLSSHYASECAHNSYSVQHHHAHVLSCMADNNLRCEVLGVAWDGAGYGPDGTIWGGEFLHTDGESFERVGHFRCFRLPGGEAVAREPRRSALGALSELLGDTFADAHDLPCIQAFTPDEMKVLAQMLRKGINAPKTTSIGRLFDAVASLTGLRHLSTFEGQAAMELEFAAEETGLVNHSAYELTLSEGRTVVVDWRPVLRAIIADVRDALPVATISARFHNWLAEAICAVADRVGISHVVLSGGCFQNAYLAERAIQRLREEGFVPYWHRNIPPNDGGIALGQALAAARYLSRKKSPCV
jgi:hydrogenase maturation protein HypF